MQSVNRLVFNTILVQYCSAKFARAQPSHIRSDRIGSEEEMLFGTHVDTSRLS